MTIVLLDHTVLLGYGKHDHSTTVKCLTMESMCDTIYVYDDGRNMGMLRIIYHGYLLGMAGAFVWFIWMVS